MTNRGLIVAAALLVLSLASINFFVVRSSNDARDDAYISLRYAKNLAEGEGFRFNPGGERVEGFSSPLHVMVMAALIRVGGDPMAVSQFTSLMPGLVTVMAVFFWGRRRWGLLWGTMAALAVAFQPGFSHWCRGGLETTGFAMILTFLLIAAAESRWRVAAAQAGMLAITRPEGILYWAPLFAFATLVRHREGHHWHGMLRLVGYALAVSLPWVLFRVVYFRDVLPNTYYAKMDGLRSAQMERGLVYLGSFLNASEVQMALGLVLLAGLFLLVAWRRGRSTGTWVSWPLLALGFLACTGFFVLSAGGDWMGNHRFLVPAVPMLMMLATAGGRQMGTMVSHRAGRVALTALLAFFLLSQPIRIFSHDLRHPHRPLDRPLGLVEPLDDGDVPRLFRLGKMMKGIMAEDATFALVPVGAPGYSSERHIIDMLGLNDREIAHLEVPDMGRGPMGHEKGNSAVILARRPDFIMLRHHPNAVVDEISPPDRELVYAPVRQLWEEAAFHERYEPFLVPIDVEISYTVYRRIAGD